MTKNRVLVLLVMTIAAVVLVVVLGDRPPQRAEGAGAALLPGLSDVVNEIDAIDIVAPGGQVSIALRRDDQRWRVDQRDGYEADFAQVLQFLRDLAEVRTADPRTANPDWYGRIGVADIDAGKATGRRIDFPGRDGIASVIVGQTDPTDSGSYARRAGEEQSWLLDRVIEVPVDPVNWLEPGIMDIPSDDIASVLIRHADGATVQLQRVGEEDVQFVLLGVPEGREAGPAWRRTAIANGLRALNLDDVRRFDQAMLDEASLRVLFVTTDGLNFVAEFFELDGGRWVHFNVSAENPATGEESAEAVDENPEEDPDAVLSESEQRLASAVAADARLSPWLFRIPERRFNDLNKRMEDLLEPLEEE